MTRSLDEPSPCGRLRWPIFALALATSLWSTAASAALGEDASTLRADSIRLGAALRVKQASGYSVHEMETPNGVVVRQFVSPSGKVFGVAWEGPFKPDMQQILGAYFNRYMQAAESMKKRSRRRPLSIQESGFVLHMSGRQRGFWGSAYLPQMLPPSVSADEIH